MVTVLDLMRLDFILTFNSGKNATVFAITVAYLGRG
jgi:hypothetical protein